MDPSTLSGLDCHRSVFRLSEELTVVRQTERALNQKQLKILKSIPKLGGMGYTPEN